METEPSPSSSSLPLPAGSGLGLNLTDLNPDALAYCASFLSLADVSSLAAACKPLRAAAHSDAVWRRLFTERWPSQSISPGAEGIRGKYFDRHVAVNQLRFSDPMEQRIYQVPVPFGLIMLRKNEAFLAQGSTIRTLTLGPSVASIRSGKSFILEGHNATITSMRLFPGSETSLLRSSEQNDENVLITSSSDRTIRVWLKGRLYRCLKGHNGPVTTLGDKLVGDFGSKLLASGGEDCTVRLWSVGGKKHPLVTFHGHVKPVLYLSVARHKSSLLLSMSRDSRVRVWDTSSSSLGSSSCVGMVGFPGTPVGMKCHDAMCYIATGSSVTAVDIRTMQKVSTAAIHPPKLYSFEILPSEWSICTGGEDKALLWDIRKNHARPEPVAELDHGGRVTLLHMDPYKVVTGGPSHSYANVWETGTGALANQLDCQACLHDSEHKGGLSAMSVEGCRIITSWRSTEDPGALYYRDFSNCSKPNSSSDKLSGSKFWEPSVPSDGDDL